MSSMKVENYLIVFLVFLRYPKEKIRAQLVGGCLLNSSSSLFVIELVAMEKAVKAATKGNKGSCRSKHRDSELLKIPKEISK